jgi:glycosyltransferase involved in cell wall biosynthesis
MKARAKFDLCMVNSPIRYPNEAIFLDHDIQVLRSLCHRILVITGNFLKGYDENVKVINIERKEIPLLQLSMFQSIWRQLITQLRLAHQIVKFRSAIKLVLFNIGEYRNLLPLVVAKLLRKKTVVFQHGGNKILESKILYSRGVKRFFVLVDIFLLRASYALTDYILCQTPHVIKFGKLQRYAHKIIFWPGCYIDVERFKPKKMPEERENLIGYTGRLSPVKGVVNLVKAIPLVLEKRSDVKFIICGIGPEKPSIEATIRELRLDRHVTLLPWLPDDEFTDLLTDKLKVFVLPSYEEAVPQVIREAMASGVIVLTTPVGGLPDLVKDGETGFIMENNTPECIARHILRVLDNPDLTRIAQAARIKVVSQNSFQAVRDTWDGILKYLVQNRS